MKKNIYNILRVFIIFQILLTVLFPNIIFASISNDIKNLSKVTGTEGSGKNYQIIPAAEELNDSEFETWTNAMLDLLDNALNGNENGNRAYVIGQSGSNSEKDLEEAIEAMSTLRLDIAEIADLENYMMTNFDIQIGSIEIKDIPLVGKLGQIKINKDEQDRIMRFRKALVDKFGVSYIGETQKYIESAHLTYKAALSKKKNEDSKFNKSLDEKKKFSAGEIKLYYKSYGYNYNVSSNQSFQSEKNELENEWVKTLGLSSVEELKDFANQTIKEQGEQLQGDTEDGLNEKDAKTQKERIDPDKDTKFSMPKNKTSVANNGPSDMINDADAFVNDSEATNYLKTENLQTFSQTTYGVLLGVGVVISVIIGMILGIKIMLAPVSQKAEAKKMLIPYIVGCIVVFGAFGIWRIAVMIMQEV